MTHKIIFQNTFYQILTKAVTAFLGFLVTIIIARSFGVEGFGDFTKIIAYIGLFFLFIDFGLTAVFLKEKESDFKKLFYSRLLISFGIFVVANLIAVFLPYNASLGIGFSQFIRLGIFIYSFSLFAQATINSASAVFQRNLNYKPYFLSISLGSIINFITVTVFSLLGFSIIYIILAFVFSTFVSGVLALYLVREKILPISVDFAYTRNMLIKSFPIGLMLIFNLVYFRADMLILSFLKPTADVGIYGIAYKFFDFLIALPLFLSNSLYPFLIINKEKPSKFFSLTKSYFLIFLVSSIIIIFPFWFLSPLFTLIKSDFSLAIFPFRILILSLPFFFLTSFLQWILISLEKQKFLAIVYFFSTVLNLTLNVIFIPKWSYLASATITGVCEGIVFLLLAYKMYSVKISLEKEQKNE